MTLEGLYRRTLIVDNNDNAVSPATSGKQDTANAALAIIQASLNIDGVTNWLKVIDGPHHEAHDGWAFFAIHSELADDTDSLEVRIQTPDTAKRAHMTILIDCALAGTAELWVPTTKTDVVGNRITPFNRDNDSSNVSGLTICHTPGGSQAGTANLAQYTGAASSNGRVNVGGNTASRGEFILKRNSSYLIKVTSRADSNALSVLLDWYMKTPDNA